MSDYEGTDEEGWAIDEWGQRFGYCNDCGEEAAEFADCCDSGEVVPYGEVTA